jgi:hypothetical protein
LPTAVTSPFADTFATFGADDDHVTWLVTSSGARSKYPASAEI